MKVKFGTNVKKEPSGTDLYVRIFQLSSLLSMIYIFIASGYTMLVEKNVFSVLFDVGISALPRGEALLLSILYRKSKSEVAVYFAALVFALIFGVISSRLLRASKKASVLTRYVFIVFIAADLIIRFLPLHFNTVFPLYAAITGFAIRTVCLILIILDLKKAQRD